MSPLPPSIADAGVLAFLDAPAWLARRALVPVGRVILPLQLIAVLPAAAGQFLTIRGTAGQDYLAVGLGYALLYGGSLLSMALTAVALSAATWGMEQCLQGRPFTTGDALRWASRFDRLLTTLLVQFVIIMGAAFCVVPGLAAAMYLGLSVPVMAAEDLAGGRAIDRSITLARHGRNGPWFTSTGAYALALVCVFTLLNYSVGSLSTLPAAVIGGWAGIRAAAEGGDAAGAMTALPVWLMVTLSVSAAFVYVLSYLYLVAGGVLLRRRAQELTEGIDILEAIATPASPASEEARP